MEYLFKLCPFRMLLRVSQAKALRHFRPISYLVHSHSQSLNNSRAAQQWSPCFLDTQRTFAKKAQGKLSKGKQKLMHLSEEEMSDLIDVEDYKSQLFRVQEKLKRDFVEFLSLRTSNIENVQVELDGQQYPLNELAQISKKNQNLIAINLSEFPEALKPAIQAITASGSGMNPQQEGTMIYLAVPKLTREHRETLSKNAKTLFIKAKDEIRSIQNTFVREAKRKTDLSEDLVFNTTNQIMAMAEKNVVELEKILKTKQSELLGDEKNR